MDAGSVVMGFFYSHRIILSPVILAGMLILLALRPIFNEILIWLLQLVTESLLQLVTESKMRYALSLCLKVVNIYLLFTSIEGCQTLEQILM